MHLRLLMTSMSTSGLIGKKAVERDSMEPSQHTHSITPFNSCERRLETQIVRSSLGFPTSTLVIDPPYSTPNSSIFSLLSIFPIACLSRPYAYPSSHLFSVISALWPVVAHYDYIYPYRILSHPSFLPALALPNVVSYKSSPIFHIAWGYSLVLIRSRKYATVHHSVYFLYSTYLSLP